jgi:exportin-7
VNGLLTRHTAEYFPFLALPGNSRHRTTFYATLARLVFMEDESDKFEPFIAPILDTTAKLATVVTMRNEEVCWSRDRAPSRFTHGCELHLQVMRALIGVCRDLRGIVSAAHNRPTYSALFDALFPTHVQTLVRAADTWADTPAVTTPLLKFM